MPAIPTIFAEISSTSTNPSTVVAVTLSAVSLFLVVWRLVLLGYRVRIARKMAVEFAFLASSERDWKAIEQKSREMSVGPMDHVISALQLLSKIDLEAYVIDALTRSRIDRSLVVLQSRLASDNERRSPG